MAELTYREMGLNDEEYEKIKEIMGREPNYVETGMWSVMWSEHCGYKNSRPLLKTLPTEGDQVIQGPGENAGIVDIGDGQALVFKIESHNHPSAIEPYQGAATGVGGIVRDIFTMGARPIANLNSLRFGDLSDARVRELFSGVVAGIAGYGNCLGIPTIGGEVYFNPVYQGNPLVNAMCVGLVQTDAIALAVAGDPGLPIMIVGARTGRDGIHGATFASEELSEKSQEKRPAVQVGDPFMEKLLIEACLELIQADLISGMQDLGAAGLTSSVAECASKELRGVEMDVLLVPRREQDMSAYEVMLSESQERMLVVPKAGCEQSIIKIFEKWGLDAAVIGRVTDDGVFRVKEGEQIVAELPVYELTTGCPTYVREGREPEYYRVCKHDDMSKLVPMEIQSALEQLLAVPSIANKEWVYRQYDHQVMTNTVLVPGAADAAVLRIRGTQKGVAFCTDCNGRMVWLDPYMGTILAVGEAALNLACTGARPLALTNCLNFGNPEKAEIYWQMQQAIAGMGEAARALNTPVVSGNVSLYNETVRGAIFPTPTIGMVGLLPEVGRRCDMAWKAEGDLLLLLGGYRDEIGGSEYLSSCYGRETGAVPVLELAVQARLIELLLTAIGRDLLCSAHDVADGGLAVSLTECAITGSLGCEIRLDTAGMRPDYVLFSEAPGRVVISIKADNLEALRHLAEQYQIPAVVLGRVNADRIDIQAGDQRVDLSVERARQIWMDAIPAAMG